MRMRLLVVMLLGACFVCVLAPTARAETIRLATGKTLEVSDVTFRGDRIEVRMERDGGSARVVLRFDQLESTDILPLWDRTHDVERARDVLSGAELALRLGAHAEAASRFEVAARLDASLRSEANAGFARIQQIESRAAVQDVEARVRDGHDLRGAAMLAQALLDGPQSAQLSAPQRRRIQALAALAAKLAAREAVRLAKQQAELDAALAPKELPALPKQPAPGADGGAAPPAAGEPGSAALSAIRARIADFARRADDAREAAAVVTITPRQAIRHLGTAADAYLLARRLVREAPPALHKGLALLGDDLRLALVSTYLDLADLFRQEGRIDEARARVRAVLILDPGNEQAWAQRRLIEDDIKNPPAPEYDERRGGGVEFFYYSPSPFWGGRYCGYPRAVPYYGYPRAVPYRGGLGHLGVRAHFGFGGGQYQTGGTRRVVGRRR